MKPFKHIPNTLTCCNLLCGALSIHCAFGQLWQHAFLLMLLAAVFDFLDGFSARLLKAYSGIGKELDSLADLVSFGLAPSFILWNAIRLYHRSALLHPLPEWIYGLSLAGALSVAVFSALRLAKFNTDPRQSENFIGLATPSCALLIGSLMYAAQVYSAFGLWLAEHYYFLAAAAFLLALLLVSEIPMFSFKFKNFSVRDNARRFLFIAVAALLGAGCLAARLNWSLWVSGIFIAYILLNAGAALCRRREKSA